MPFPAASQIRRWIQRQIERRAARAAFREGLCAPAPLSADFFDAPWYLRHNPDVAQSGADPWLHWLDVGAREGRPPGPGADTADITTRLAIPAHRVEDRRAFLLQHIDRTSKILEIGGGFAPLVTRRGGHDVFTLDKGSQEELRARWAPFPQIDVTKIEPVDFVWRGGDILTAIPPEHLTTFDVVLMAGVIEHVPDPIGLLRALQKLLKPGGRLALSVPDKRHCFDALRPVTTPAAWLEAFSRRDVVHSPRNLYESKTMSVASKGRLDWTENRPRAEHTTFIGSAVEQAHAACFAIDPATPRPYEDAHAWVFTPSSFTLIVNECHQLGLIQLVPECVSTRCGAEFLAHMRLARRRPFNHHERLQLLFDSAREQAEGYRAYPPARGFGG